MKFKLIENKKATNLLLIAGNSAGNIIYRYID